MKNRCIAKIPNSEEFGLFENHIAYFVAHDLSEINPILQQISKWQSGGYYAVGYLAYEAAPVFDDNFLVNKTSSPLLEFYIYQNYKKIDESFMTQTNENISISPELTEDEYNQAIAEILENIKVGNIYQANYTFRAKVNELPNDNLAFFLKLQQIHKVPYAAYLEFPQRTIISISPELFLEKRGDLLISIPMKGTMPRHYNFEQDQQIKQFLSSDAKNCAENLMIVDMVRNDFARVSKTGTIEVDPLLHVDTYRTVHQMVSTVKGKTTAAFTEILSATFPAASITGAPKIRAMSIIKELEKSPRGVYCGTIGCLAPNGDFLLNVPIRTVTLDDAGASIGIGSGVVADSQNSAEWQECLLKASFLNSSEKSFQIFETLAWLPQSGYTDLDEHLLRLANSQKWFGRSVADWKRHLPKEFSSPQRIKIIVDEKGEMIVEHSDLANLDWGVKVAKLKISDKIISSKNIFQYHKTTNRELYNNEYQHACLDGYDEVIFFNENGELTEGAISNIFVKINGQWLTPAINSGILPGIKRAKLILELAAQETKISKQQFFASEQIIICNSLRGKTKAKIVKA